MNAVENNKMGINQNLSDKKAKEVFNNKVKHELGINFN